MGAKSRLVRPETVYVAVVVNHDQLRRGETGEVELTDDVRGRLDKGYLRLAGPDETGNPLGGTPAAVPGPVALLGVISARPTAVTTNGAADAEGGPGNGAG